ncbi:MAG TPA: spermidine/putrescine ABC transporter substrate-binding protein [Solirubrobacterales bacterium]
MRDQTTKLIAAIAFCVLALGAAACGSDLGGGGNEGDVTTAEAEGTASGELAISNWPFYIDKDTVPEFEEETGIKVDYTEDVNDNNEFFAKVQPELDNGESGGASIYVVTDWMAQKMYDLGYLQEFDKEAIPNFEENLTANLASPGFDPERNYSAPWQSGMTGLIVNKGQAPDLTSIEDLFDPQYKGEVEVLTELRDTVPLVMKSMGVDVEDATTEDWLAAIDKLGEAVDSGQIVDFTGNDYTADLARGDVSAVIGWSGDAIQLQADDPDIEFRMPEEGCIQWSDNMVIPVGAPNPTAAYEWIDYVYDPENQAQITDYNYYVSPVEGVQEILEEQGSDAAKSDLVFPSEDYVANCSSQPNPPAEDEEEIEKAFQQVITG